MHWGQWREEEKKKFLWMKIEWLLQRRILGQSNSVRLNILHTYRVHRNLNPLSMSIYPRYDFKGSLYCLMLWVACDKLKNIVNKHWERRGVLCLSSVVVLLSFPLFIKKTVNRNMNFFKGFKNFCRGKVTKKKYGKF